MPVANLFNVPIDDTTLAQWSFAHMAHHRDILLAIYNDFHVALPEYALDPFNPTERDNWEYLHQQMHDQMNAICGVDGNNLLFIDWQNENARAGWILLNGAEHRQVGDFLSVG
jgi:hypothetical protein